MSPSVCITGLGVLALSSACGDPPARTPLQQVMFEIDAAKQRLEESLILPRGLAASREHAAAIESRLSDPAYEDYLGSPRFPGDPERFGALRSDFEGVFHELDGALLDGDLERARRAYPRMLDACTACHDLYRPGL